jgi:prevent-host-death family protein
MLTVHIHEAKTHLSRLLDRAAKGEPFIIAKAGKPLVKVVPLGGITVTVYSIEAFRGRYSTSRS